MYLDLLPPTEPCPPAATQGDTLSFRPPRACAARSGQLDGRGSSGPNAFFGPLGLVGLLFTGLFFAGTTLEARADTTSSYADGRFQAPTRLFAVPAGGDLVALPGDSVSMRYSLGALDRSARLQTQLQVMTRSLQRHMSPAPVTVYVLNRQQWLDARIPMPYGLPVRVGQGGLATPASGDEETARLWNELGIALPSSPGPSYRTASDHAPSIAMADLLAMMLMAEIQVDRAALAGDEFWVRGLMTHLALVGHFERTNDARIADMDLLYRTILEQRGKKSLASSDYRAEISTADWLWFQAALHFGARTLLNGEGRGVWGKMRKLRKRAGGVLTGASLLSKYDSLTAWYHETFAAFSTRPAD